jgi:hypothetical protein
VPASARNLVILADVKGALWIRIFDDTQRRIVDIPEPRAGPIADLKRQVASLRTRHELTSSEKDRVVASVTGIVADTLGEKGWPRREHPAPRAIKSDGTVLRGRLSGLESVTFRYEFVSNQTVFRFAEVGAMMIRPASTLSPISDLQLVVEVQSRGKIESTIQKRLKINPASNSVARRQPGAPLPQPGPELESLLDVDGWLSLGDSPSAAAGRSIHAPAGEIGSAEVSLRTTPPRDLELRGQSGAVTHVGADLSSQAEGKPLVHNLGGKIGDIVPGGGGRYLVLSLTDPHRLAVFDVNAASIVREISLASEDVFVAAGAVSFFLAHADRRVVEEWDFATLRRKRAFPFPFKGRLTGIAMGMDSEGPLLAVWVPPTGGGPAQGACFCMIDVKSGKVLRVQSYRHRDFGGWIRELPASTACLTLPSSEAMHGPTARIRASADGRRFVIQEARQGGWGVSGLAILDLERSGARTFGDMTQSLAVLSPDGGQVCSDQITYQPSAAENPHAARTGRMTNELPIPALDPSYHLIVRLDPDSKNISGAVKELVIKNAWGTLATVSNLEEMRFKDRQAVEQPRDPLFDRRFLLIPAAKLLITIPPDEGRIVLRRLDVEELLQRPLRILRGEKPRKSAPEPSGSPHLLSGKGKPGVGEQESGAPRALIPDLNVILIVLTVLSYLAGLIQQALWNRQGTRGDRSREQKRRHRLVSALILVVATGLTLTCIAVEWLAFRNATAVNRLLEQRTEDSARPVLTLQELQPLIGRPPESSSGENGRIVASYSWKGIIRKYRLHLECAKGKGNDTIVTSYFFE